MDHEWEMLKRARVNITATLNLSLWAWGQTHPKLQYFGHLMWRADSLQKTRTLGKTEGQENRTTEDEVVGWHHRLNRHEFAQTLGDGEGQRSLACCSSLQRVRQDLATELNQTEPDHLNDKGQPPWASHPHQPQCWGHRFSAVEIPKEPGWLCLCPHKQLKASLTVWIQLIVPFSWAQMVYYQQFHSIWPKPQTHFYPV